MPDAMFWSTPVAITISFNPLAGIFYCLTSPGAELPKIILNMFQSPCGDFLLPDMAENLIDEVVRCRFNPLAGIF